MAEITNFLMQSSMMTFAVKVALVVEAAVKMVALAIVFLEVMELMVVEVKELAVVVKRGSE